jgi:hypothetical protein
MRNAVLIVLALAAVPAPLAIAQNSRKMDEVQLDFDPAKPEPIVGWWSNGRELLHLAPNGAYRMWVSQDRFKYPLEVGAWRRENYAFFDLEPYRAKPGTRIRVNMQKDAGTTELVRDGLADFRWSAAPPHIMADDMLGAWVAPTEQLLVFENGRYEWRRTAPASGITEHSGAWNSEQDVLVLAPDSPAIDNQRLRLVREPGGAFALETANGRLMHPPEAPKPEPSSTPGLRTPRSGSGSSPTEPTGAGPAPGPGVPPAPAAPGPRPAASAPPTPAKPIADG